MQLTDEQQAIVAEGRAGKDHILIDAKAGCAKTTTLIEVIKVLPQRSILFAAFNRGIADEATARMPKIRGTAIVVQTFHAIGRAILLKRFPRLAIDKTATETLVNDACDRAFRSAPYEIRRAAMRLVRCAKETLSPAAAGWEGYDDIRAWRGWDDEILLELGFEQNLFGTKLSTLQIERVVGIAQIAIRAGLDLHQRTTIDFCDMVWGPLVLELASPSRYQAIVLDEVQDISAPQLELLQHLALPQTRFIAAGDTWQQIYGWRGSLGGRAWAHFEARGARRFPLTMTWRCSHAVVRAANALVPELRAQPNAEEGSEQTCTLGELPSRLAQTPSKAPHTFVLSRQNAALLDCALFLWRAGVQFKLNAADDILDPLFAVFDRELDLASDEAFRKSLFAWHEREAAKADQAGATSRREQIDEQRAILLAALRYAAPRRIRGLLKGILADNRSGVLLSTVHKVKGLEAERVFLLKQTFARHAEDQPSGAYAGLRYTTTTGDGAERRIRITGFASGVLAAPPAEEELHIEYVGITRAKLHLFWVDLESRAKPALLTMPVAQIPAAELDNAFAMVEREMLRAAELDDAKALAAVSARMDAILKRIGGR